MKVLSYILSPLFIIIFFLILGDGESVFINRQEGKEAIKLLVEFSKSPNELKMLAKYNPKGYVVPITINNSWKLLKYGKFPLGLGFSILITTHKPININPMSLPAYKRDGRNYN